MHIANMLFLPDTSSWICKIHIHLSKRNMVRFRKWHFLYIIIGLYTSTSFNM